MTNKETAKALENLGGKRWSKGDKDRVYLQNIDTEAAFGFAPMVLNARGYNGRKTSWLNGEKISNNAAFKLSSSVAHAYYDVTTGSFVGLHSDLAYKA